MENEGGGDPNCSWCTWNGLQMLAKGTGRAGNQRMDQEYPDNKIVEVG